MSEGRDESRDRPRGERREQALQAVREHPLPYLLGAAALGFVVARMVRRER